MTGSNAAKLRVLVAEDEPLVADLLVHVLQEADAEVVGVGESAEQVLLLAGETRPDIAVLDVRLGAGLDGIGVAQMLRDVYSISVIFVTGSGDRDTRRRMEALLPLAILQKPFLPAQVKNLIELAKRRGAGP